MNTATPNPGLSHKNVDFEWLTLEALDIPTKQCLQKMQKVREVFIETGQYPFADDDVTIRLRHATLATTLNCSYSTLYAYQEIFLYREHDKWKQSLPTNGAVVDAGANEGLYAIAVCMANPEATVYSIEPNPISLSRLQKNLELNGVADRCHIISAALWSSNAEQQLHYLPFVTTNASLQNVRVKSKWLLTPAAKTVSVRTSTLDELLAPYDLATIPLVKMDIEGSEAQALLGASETISKTDRMVIEYHSDELRDMVINILTVRHDFHLQNETRDAIHSTESCGNLYFTR